MSFKKISTDVIDGLVEVRFYDETIAHIKEGHPEIPIELPCVTSAVEKAIVNPTVVEESYDNSFVFVDEETTNKSGDPLRVPVKVIEGTNSGRVKTAYFATSDEQKPVRYRRKQK